MTQEKVSIIVPIYNVENYLDQCIQSLVNQTYRDIEILLINDGSKDHSDAICRKYRERDDRIIYICQENQGVSIARNKGIQYATGAWISFVDGDDWVSADMIETLIKQAGDSDMVVGDAYVAKKSRLIKTSFFDSTIPFSDRNNIVYLIGNALASSLYCSSKSCSIAVPWAKLYRRSLLQNYHLEFPVGIRRMQDMVFNINLFSKTNKITFCSNPIYFYRLTENSASRRYDPYHAELSQQILSLIKDPLLSNTDYNMQNLFEFKKMWLLLEEISLNYCHPQNDLSFNDKVNKIKELFNISANAKTLATYDKKLFSKKQKIILCLLKKHLYGIIPVLYAVKKRIDDISL